MSLIDRVTNKQKGRTASGSKRLAPAPVRRDSILDDIDAWEADTKGRKNGGMAQSASAQDVSAMMERFVPQDRPNAVLSKATKKQRQAEARAAAEAAAAAEAEAAKAHEAGFEFNAGAKAETAPVEPSVHMEPSVPVEPSVDQTAEAVFEAEVESPPVVETRNEEPGRKSREFAFDHERLRKFGFITPKERRSRISEEFRLVKRRLMQRMSLSAKDKADKKNGDRQHVIVVTSARPSEGKSFVAMNLALSIIFDEGLNVLLVDGDVARPSMSKILGLRNDLPGLTDLLLDDESELPNVLLREHEHPLSYLAAGAMVASATDLFGGDAMHTLVTDMAERYSDRIIIFDAPPLLASTEPVALAEHAGQVVMVVDAERTSRSAVDSALDLLETDQNVNLVLNKTTVRNRTEQFGSYYEAYNQVAP